MTRPNLALVKSESVGKVTKRASARKVKVEEAKEPLVFEKEIIFIDVSQSEEIEQKDSFINEEEATSVMDYIKAHHSHLLDKGQTCAVMSPFRPQGLLLKN